MAEVRIREAALSDRAGMAAAVQHEPFWKRYGLNGTGADRLVEQALASGGCVVADTETDLAAGWAWLMPSGGFGRGDYVRFLAVDPGMQGRGVGRALMENAERRATRTTDGLFVMASSVNAPALAFYATLGYQPVGRIPDLVLPGLDEILFWKDLRTSA